METPFDSAKLDSIMAKAGADLILASSRHNVRYLLGGHYYHFHEFSTRMGLTQYLPYVGIPRGRLERSFYVGRPDEQGQIDSAGGIWPVEFAKAERGTSTATAKAIEAITARDLDTGVIAVELPFLPSDAYIALKTAMPQAAFVDATPMLDELRAVKSPAEIDRMRSAYARTAESIQAAFASAREGMNTREIEAIVKLEMAKRGVSFIFALVCAGPSFLRAPSSETWTAGNILHIDAGGTDGDFVADICRMGSMGPPSRLARELHAACLEVQSHVRALVRPGISMDELLRRGIERAQGYSFGRYSRFVVHGIGMVPYEAPRTGQAPAARLEAGHILSIETDFLHPEVGHVKIEDAVLVTSQGHEGLGDGGREWQVLEP